MITITVSVQFQPLYTKLCNRLHLKEHTDHATQLISCSSCIMLKDGIIQSICLLTQYQLGSCHYALNYIVPNLNLMKNGPNEDRQHPNQHPEHDKKLICSYNFEALCASKYVISSKKPCSGRMESNDYNDLAHIELLLGITQAILQIQ